MLSVSKWGFRAMAMLGWVTVGLCIIGIYEERPDGFVAVAIVAGMSLLWLAMIFALGPIVWQLTAALPHEKGGPKA